MKKKALVAAVLAATTLTATPALAAQNPFKDMPQGHWAYDAVNMLVKDGVIDGYGDGTFGGDKLMNRYEMAEIVANAAKKYGNVSMKDKGAIKKLEREFKAELKDMDARLAGVEQDVAQLKKNQSSFKWYGDTRVRYIQNKDNKMTDKNSAYGKERQWEKRVRLGIYGEPAKNLSVDARIKYEDESDQHNGWGDEHRNQNVWDNTWHNQNTFRLDKASLIWNNAGTRWAIGRNQVSIGQGGIWWENPIDGITVSHQFGPKVNLMAGYGDLSAEGWHDTTMWAYFTNLSVQTSPATQVTFGSLHTNSTLEHATTQTNYSLGYDYSVTDTSQQVTGTDGNQHWASSTWTNSDGSFWGWNSTDGNFQINTEGGNITKTLNGDVTANETTTWNKKDYKFNQFSLGFNSQLTSKWKLMAEGLYNNVSGKNVNGGDLDKKGFLSRVTYGHSEWRKGGTWEIFGEYFALGNASIDSKYWGHHLNIAGGNSNWSDANDWGNGDRGWGLGFSYMLAANTNFEFSYYKLKPFDKNASYSSFNKYEDTCLAALTYSF